MLLSEKVQVRRGGVDARASGVAEEDQRTMRPAQVTKFADALPCEVWRRQPRPRVPSLVPGGGMPLNEECHCRWCKLMAEWEDVRLLFS